MDEFAAEYVFLPSEIGRFRSRISHSFLDHELLQVSIPDALTRWKLGEWTCFGNRLENSFQSYERDAERFERKAPATVAGQQLIGNGNRRSGKNARAVVVIAKVRKAAT